MKVISWQVPGVTDLNASRTSRARRNAGSPSASTCWRWWCAIEAGGADPPTGTDHGRGAAAAGRTIRHDDKAPSKLIRKRHGARTSLYTLLQMPSLTMFEKTPIHELLASLERKLPAPMRDKQLTQFEELSGQ
jgi:hypothetical protein